MANDLACGSRMRASTRYAESRAKLLYSVSLVDGISRNYARQVIFHRGAISIARGYCFAVGVGEELSIPRAGFAG